MEKPEICGICKHSMENNLHGPDQNDMFMVGDKVEFTGSCTYCRVCSPGLDKLLREKGK